MSLVPSGPASLDRIQKIREAPIFLTCHTLRHWKSKELVTSSPSSYVSGCSSTSVLPLSVLTQHQRAPPCPGAEHPDGSPCRRDHRRLSGTISSLWVGP